MFGKLCAIAATMAFTISGNAMAASTDIAASGYSYLVGPNGSYPDTGGTELTDGCIAEYHSPSYSGNGYPYVGWLNVNPSIRFNFASSQNFGSLTVWVDDFSGSFGVTAPSSISAVIGGVTYSSFSVGTPLDVGHDYTGQPGSQAQGGGTPYVLDLSGASGSQIDLTVQRGGEWTFLSEVQFSSLSPSVPEPTSWAMLIMGFGLVGTGLRRRTRPLVQAF